MVENGTKRKINNKRTHPMGGLLEIQALKHERLYFGFCGTHE